ncbi:phosphate ABC transporter substrate-binding protein [Methylocystis sp. FS]|nr:phosphate ABC transporter substrate-binding protein [Methylocystis silviterrae]
MSVSWFRGKDRCALASIGRICAVYIAFFSSSLGHAADNRLVLTGSSTVAPLAAEIGKRFEEQNPSIRVDVQSGGSSRGVADARSGLADLGMASRAPNADETDLQFFTIARDGVGIIVNTNNSVRSLTDEQIVAIYTGKIADWSKAGGAAGRITVVNKAEGRSTLELFLHYFKLKGGDVKAHVIIGENQQAIKTVAGNPGAIGYVSIGSAEYEAGHGAHIRLLPMSGVAASVENVRSGSFPLSRPLNLVSKGAPGAVARRFIDFARSRSVHDIVESQFFVPVAP